MTLATLPLRIGHYVHLARAQQMLRGEWPSRDVVDLGAPLTYAISATAQARSEKVS